MAAFKRIALIAFALAFFAMPSHAQDNTCTAPTIDLPPVSPTYDTGSGRLNHWLCVDPTTGAVTAAGISGGSSAIGAVFVWSTNCSGLTNCFQGVDDDSTDNCGAALTTWLTAINSYAGPGVAQVWIGDSNGGKAYKLAACNLAFTQPRTIYLWANLDCQQNNTFSNCIQEGPTGLVNFTNAQTSPYTIDGTGVITGCANVTVACIEAEKYVSNPRIFHIHMTNVGAGNASPPACTNYAVSFDGGNNAPMLEDTVYWMTDSITGRCWSVNNRLAVAGGTNSAYIIGNTVVAAGSAPGFTSPCGSIGHSELGAATMIVNNQFYGFGQPLLLLNPQFGTMIRGNQVDQAGCTTNVASGDIQYGNSSNGAVAQVSIVDNYFPGGAGHASAAVIQASGSSSALSNLTFIGNKASGSAVKNMIGTSGSPTIPPSCTGDCKISLNENFAPTSEVLNWYIENVAGIGGQVAQAADVSAQTLLSVPAAGIYRITCELKITRAATISSTLPACLVGYTDADTSTVTTREITPTWAATTISCNGSTTNTVGNGCGGSIDVTAASGTIISYSTSGYTSSGATTMQFTIRGRVERLN